MTKAIWNGKVLAESDVTRVVEGNRYCPPDAIKQEYLRESPAETVCGWKGTAKYFDIVVDDGVIQQAAWYYPDPKPAAADIRGYVAFCKGVEVSD